MEVNQYVTNSGTSPFSDWYKKLDRTLKIKVDARIQRIKTLKNFGDKRNLKEGVFELRFISHSGFRWS